MNKCCGDIVILVPLSRAVLLRTLDLFFSYVSGVASAGLFIHISSELT